MRIALANLRKTYPGRVRAVRDLSLEVADGELLVILGPSGCGKTTVLRLLAGLEKPSGGHVLFDGKRVTRRRPADRHVGFVFQQPVLYPHMTVRQNLAFVLRRAEITSNDKAQCILTTAKLFQIEPLLERKPTEISVGEQQRVAMARATLREPSCMLLDEPLTSLDAPLRAELRSEIRAMHARTHITTIYVTHDQQEAFALADRVAIMAHGELQQVAPPRAMYRSPGNAFVARFLGSPGMNLIDGVLTREDGRTVFNAGESLRVPIAQGQNSNESREVTLGVRPEEITINPAGTPPDEAGAAFELEVTAIEPLGDRTLIHTRTVSGVPVVIKTAGTIRHTQPGQHISARVRPEVIHVFERGATGQRIQ